jgi:hypothetical protein
LKVGNEGQESGKDLTKKEDQYLLKQLNDKGMTGVTEKEH